MYFNPRIPRGMRQNLRYPAKGRQKFQSTHPARDATRDISSLPLRHTDFNPRIPRGMRQTLHAIKCIECGFQSTHPARDATFCPSFFCCKIYYFNPRIPRGMRRTIKCGNIVLSKFQSTHPARDATNKSTKHVLSSRISIHASREGCDCLFHSVRATCPDFNPRIPRGMRRE